MLSGTKWNCWGVCSGPGTGLDCCLSLPTQDIQGLCSQDTLTKASSAWGWHTGIYLLPHLRLPQPSQALPAQHLPRESHSSPTSSSGTASLFFSTNPSHWYSTWQDTTPTPASACSFPDQFGAELCLDTVQARGKCPCRSQKWWWPHCSSCPAVRLLMGTRTQFPYFYPQIRSFSPAGSTSHPGRVQKVPP